MPGALDTGSAVAFCEDEGVWRCPWQVVPTADGHPLGMATHRRRAPSPGEMHPAVVPHGPPVPEGRWGRRIGENQRPPRSQQKTRLSVPRSPTAGDCSGTQGQGAEGRGQRVNPKESRIPKQPAARAEPSVTAEG